MGDNSQKMKPPEILKVLYVESGIDERQSATLLERCCTSLESKMVVFTVVSNCFAALECTEHTAYNLMIIQKGLPQLDILAVLKVLRAIGDLTPIVSMEKVPQGACSTSVLSKYTEIARKVGYAGVLLQPYSANSLCECITNTLEYVSENPSQIGELNANINYEFNRQLESKELDAKNRLLRREDDTFKEVKKKAKKSSSTKAKSTTKTGAMKSIEISGIRSSGRQRERQARVTNSLSADGGVLFMDEIKSLPGPKPGEEDRAAALLSALSEFHAKSKQSETEVVDSLFSMASSSSLNK